MVWERPRDLRQAIFKGGRKLLHITVGGGYYTLGSLADAKTEFAVQDVH